jgi:MFS family permease
VLLLIGAPGMLWALVILFIKEPVRQVTEGTAEGAHPGGRADVTTADGTTTADAALPSRGANTGVRASISGLPSRSATWARVAPIYLVVATASLVDNAVGAWAPTLLIREFARNAAQVGMELGLLLTAGFGGGVLLGGWLADRVGARGGWPYKLGVCLVSGLLILPVSLLINAGQFDVVLLSVPLYFALSGIVTACGFSAILDVVPNRSRGLAMAISFFLNVALGAGVGPTAVAVASERIFGAAAGLGPAITLTVGASYALAVITLLATLSIFRTRAAAVR